MTRGGGLTVTEKLLMSALDLGSDGKVAFTAEDLVVAAWKKFPDAFGLRGHQHPDSNRVFAEIMGKKPLRKRGFLQKVGEKRYQLTALGRETAGMLKQRSDGTHSGGKSLLRETTDLLRKLLSSGAVTKFAEGRKEDMNFSDVCYFLGISATSAGKDLENSVQNVRGVIQLLESVVADGDLSFRHGDRPLTDRETKLLTQTLEFILHEFHNQFQTIRKRNRDRS